MEEGECQSGERVVDGPRKQPRQTETRFHRRDQGVEAEFFCCSLSDITLSSCHPTRNPTLSLPTSLIPNITKPFSAKANIQNPPGCRTREPKLATCWGKMWQKLSNICWCSHQHCNIETQQKMSAKNQIITKKLTQQPALCCMAVGKPQGSKKGWVGCKQQVPGGWQGAGHSAATHCPTAELAKSCVQTGRFL